MLVLNQKERKQLMNIAASLDTKYQVGKMGVTKTQLDLFDKALEAHEIIKIKVMINAFDKPETFANQISSELNAITVSIVGRTMIFYRESKKPGIEHLL